MTVYAVHPLGDKTDISSALTYGEVEYINMGYIFADYVREERPPRGFTSAMQLAADKFDQGSDYLLIAGDHLQLILMAAILNETVGDFAVLRFDREAKGYLPVIISSNTK